MRTSHRRHPSGRNEGRDVGFSRHLEEAYQVGEGVLPELARRGVLAAQP